MFELYDLFAKYPLRVYQTRAGLLRGLKEMALSGKYFHMILVMPESGYRTLVHFRLTDYVYAWYTNVGEGIPSEDGNGATSAMQWSL